MPISTGASVTAAVSTGAVVAVSLSASVDVGVGVGTQTHRVNDPYTGSYEATPTAYEQSIPTSGKTMTRNVTIHKVPYQETTNESGGVTVSILS